jgi:MoxR-like ATPase
MTGAATHVRSPGRSARDSVGRARAGLPAERRRGSLFGREVELAAVATESGSLVFVEGHAGIGKTSLLEAARARAKADGVRVLWACGHEPERGFASG